MNNAFEQFTNLYSLSKTLRFELRPISKTSENIEKNQVISNDEKRSEEYKEVKKIIDKYHKNFIEESLKDFSFEENSDKEKSLNKYLELARITNKNDKQKKKIENIQSTLRKEIVKKFETKRLFGKELIQEDLSNFLDNTELSEFYKNENTNNEECKSLVNNFCKWTTYFAGFNENRKNMYSDEEKSTAIAYRLINENLPKFIGNISVFEKIKEKLNGSFEIIKQELNLFENIDYYFNIDNYNKFLTQSGIDLFNLVIGGKTLDNKTKIKGLNEYINLYNQKQNNKNDKLPKFTPLFKMILSDRTALSWLPEQFENDNEILNAVNQFYLSVSQKQENRKSVLEQLKNLLSDINTQNFDLNKIYLRNDTSLTNISQKFFGHWNEIQKTVEARYEKENPKGKKGEVKENGKKWGKDEREEDFAERKYNFFKNHDSFSIGYLNECSSKNIETYFTEIDKNNENKDLFTVICEKYKIIENLLNTDYSPNKKLSQDKENVSKIKEFLDSVMELFHFIKPLCGKGNETDKDEKFYGEFNPLYEELSKITLLYDKVRNYMTKKPYSTEKIKLNFDNSTLCNGWDKNKEQDNTAILLRKDELFYLAIMNYNAKTKFDNVDSAKENERFYEKIDYKQIALPMGLGAFVRKCAGTASNYGWNCPTNCLNSEGKIIIKEDEATPVLENLINTYKDFLNKYEKDGFKYKDFDFVFKKSSEYETLKEFTKEVEQQGYKITFRNISEKYIEKLVEENKLYLFQIYNKDFSEYSKGTPNMHTLYWKELFSDENLRNVVYKLNGEAEVFYRKKSLNYSEEEMQKGHHAEELKGKFNYPIIKDKRFTFDKFQFHCPITLNFKAKGNEYINEDVNKFIKENGVKHIIGIDRGERHLLYVSVIDLNGKIKEQFSLNEIVNEYNNNTYKTDYHKLLDDKEKERIKLRQEWKTIESIKELKEGYLSQVIHKISELIVKYEAIVVLEDLNFGFMRGRQKFEKSVYQQFEKKLIDKLNFLVFKKKNKNEICGILNAIQITNKFKSFKEMGKQNGFLFYIAAWNTSKIDPTTGFVNMFDTRYVSIEKAKEFFSKFKEIRFNSVKNYFEFEIDNYSKFSNKVADTRLNWVICTNGERIPEKNNKPDVLSDKFKNLFNEYKIDVNSNLEVQILAQNSKEFFEKLLRLFKLTIQMRNSITGTDTDYMISPVANKNGVFFDSGKSNENLPNNADANGAYNIARKGLMLIERIKNSENLKKVDLIITNKEYLQFVQKDNCQ